MYKFTNMEVLLNLEICEGLPCYDNLELSEFDKEEIKKNVEFDNVNKVEFVNIGPGADLIVLLLTISIIGVKLIKEGAEINDGLDGWIEIGKKLKKLFLRKKIVSVDDAAATSLAIELIAQKENIVKLEKIEDSTINLVDVSGMIPNNSGLSKKPHNFYIQTYRVNDEEIYVVGIKSTGEAEIIKHFGFNQYGITEVKQN